MEDVKIRVGWARKLSIPKVHRQLNSPGPDLVQSKLNLGAICGFDPSKGSCFDTGDSGSGLLLERFQGGYSWEGPLSFYRGCQNEFINFGKSVQV